MTKAAINAAAEALYQCETGLGTDSWNRAFEVERSLWRDQAHAILEAAMPHLRKQIAEEIRYGINEYSGQLIERAARIAEKGNQK